MTRTSANDHGPSEEVAVDFLLKTEAQRITSSVFKGNQTKLVEVDEAIRRVGNLWEAEDDSVLKIAIGWELESLVMLREIVERGGHHDSNIMKHRRFLWNR